MGVSNSQPVASQVNVILLASSCYMSWSLFSYHSDKLDFRTLNNLFMVSCHHLKPPDEMPHQVSVFLGHFRTIWGLFLCATLCRSKAVDGARPHRYMLKLKCSTPVQKRLSWLTKAGLGMNIPWGW